MDKMNNFSRGVAMSIALLGFFGLLGACSEKPTTLVAIQQVDVYAIPDRPEAQGNSVVAVLPPGFQTNVLKTRYSKEFQFFQIKAENGVLGYVMYGKNIQIIKQN